MKTVKDYYKLYLKYHDLLLLVDVFENLETVPWDSKLSLTKVEPEPISDADMYLFFEKV